MFLASSYGLIVGLLLAIYGAVLSTVTAIVQIAAHRRERVDVVLKVRQNMVTLHDPRYANMQLTLVTAANRGKRPVMIQGFAAKVLDSAGQFLLTDIRPQVPHEISEGHFITAFADQAGGALEQVECYYAWDSVGRQFSYYMVPWFRRLFSSFRRRFMPRQGNGRQRGAGGADMDC